MKITSNQYTEIKMVNCWSWWILNLRCQ